MARIYQKREIRILKKGGKKLAHIVEIIKNEVKKGRSALEIDQLVFDLIVKEGGSPSFLHHDGFPASTCISINEEVVHGIPNKRKFQEGDVVGIDVGLLYMGFHTDMAVTVVVGKADKRTLDFVDTARYALTAAIKIAKPGKTTGDIGQAIQEIVEKRGYSVVRELSGHGVGKRLHEKPSVPNFGGKERGMTLKPGMVLAIEPIINLGDREVETAIDGWRIKTKDNSLSAHFEHTIVITKKGNEILTLF